MKEYTLESGKTLYSKDLTPVEIIELTTELRPLISTLGCLVDVFKQEDKTTMFTSIGYNFQQALTEEPTVVVNLYKSLCKTLCDEDGKSSPEMVEAMQFLIGYEVWGVMYWLVSEHLVTPLLHQIKKQFNFTDEDLAMLKSGFIQDQDGEEGQ